MPVFFRNIFAMLSLRGGELVVIFCMPPPAPQSFEQYWEGSTSFDAQKKNPLHQTTTLFMNGPSGKLVMNEIL